MGELRLIDAPPDALDTPAAARIGRSLAGLIALGEERERRLQQQVQAEALRRSNELKTALLRAVSHDLRSPLMAITDRRRRPALRRPGRRRPRAAGDDHRAERRA